MRSLVSSHQETCNPSQVFVRLRRREATDSSYAHASLARKKGRPSTSAIPGYPVLLMEMGSCYGRETRELRDPTAKMRGSTISVPNVSFFTSSTSGNHLPI